MSQFVGQEAALVVLSLAVLSGLLTCSVKKSLSLLLGAGVDN